jgi:hypothetical protein
MIKWETTQKTDSDDLGDLKQFSMEDLTPRKQKSTDVFSPISGKKIAQISNINQTDLIYNIAQKISIFQ